MGACGQPGRPVVGEHRLPRGQVSQLRRGGQVERKRELGAAGDLPAGRRHPQLPQGDPPRRSPLDALDERVARSRPGEQLERRAARAGAGGEVGEAPEAPAGVARCDQRLHLLLAHAAHVTEADPHASLLVEVAFGVAGVYVGCAHLEPATLRLVDERIGGIEAHRLLVEQRAQELGAVVHPQPRRLVGEQPERRPVCLGKAEAREALDHREHPLGHVLADPVHAPCPRHEPLVVGLDRRLRALAAHRPPQSLGLAGREAGEGDRHLEHLVLEDDRAQRLAQHRLERGVLVGDLVVGLDAHALAPRDVGVDRAALDGPGPHDRHLDRDVLKRLGPRAVKRLHLGAALDLEDAGGLRALDAFVCRRHRRRGSVERSMRSPRGAGDQLDRALHGREHPQPQQVDLQEARVRAGVLVPLDDLPPLHRGGDDRAAVDQRPGGDDHPARVLGEVAGKPVGLCGQARQPRPAAPRATAARAVGAVRPGLLRRGRHRRPPRCPWPPRARPSPRSPAPPARSRSAAAPGPCRAHGSRRGRGRWETPPPAPSGPGRSGRARAGSGPLGCPAGSRDRCRAARSAPR